MIVGSFLLLIFSGFSWWVANFNPVAFDSNLTTIVQKIVPLSADEFLSLFSLLGSFEIITIVLLIIILRQKNLITSLLIMGAYLYGMGIEILGKMFIVHPNPPHDLFRYDLEFIFPSSGLNTGNSFPSGHAYRSMFLITYILILIFRSKMPGNKKMLLGSLSVSVIVIMLVSRVSLGEHWTSDVIAGSLLGAGLASMSVVKFSK